MIKLFYTLGLSEEEIKNLPECGDGTYDMCEYYGKYIRPLLIKKLESEKETNSEGTKS